MEEKLTMTCSRCGLHIQDGDRYCKNCGNALLEPDAVNQHLPARSNARMPFPRQGGPHQPGTPRPQNPYKDSIAQLRLQLRELRMQLRELNNQISGTRSNYFELDSFVQRGMIHNVGRMIEGAQLFSPYQQRKQLQSQISQLDHELLSLEKAQEQWRTQQLQNR
jgi:hypothetical protein